MQRLIGLKDRFDIAFACDTDHDRHGIVTRSAGLLPPNHYLAVAIYYLFQHRPQVAQRRGGGQDRGEQPDDRSRDREARPEALRSPVGFKWFVDGLLDGSLGFGGEESAGASFLRLDGTCLDDGQGWHRSGAACGGDHGAHGPRSRRDLSRTHARIRRAGLRPRRGAGHSGAKGSCWRNSRRSRSQSTDLAGEKIQTILTQAPGNGAPSAG